MLDVANFWMAFKLSWVRRILTTNAFWPSILLGCVSRLLGKKTDAFGLMQHGCCVINDISKRISNPFWKQVLGTALPVMQGSIFTHPEKILFSPLFMNPLILRNKPVRPKDFPELAEKIDLLADLFYPGTNNFMEFDDLCARFDVTLSLEKYIDLRFTVRNTFKKLRLENSKLLPVVYPQKLLLIDFATICKKGCNKYY